MRLSSIKWLPAALLLLLAACSPAFPAIQPESPAASEESAQTAPTDTVVVEASEPTAESGPPADAPTDTAAPAVEPATEAAAAATDAPVAAECPYSPDLHATNPATVSLAAGQVQLVEFFAFW